MAVLTWTDDFFYAEQSKDVFPDIQNMLNGPGWSRRDHADWYTVLTDPANDDWTTIFIPFQIYLYIKMYIMLCKDLIIIVYLFTSSDKMIHKDLELQTVTSYTAVGSGFDPQSGVPAEKPRNLLTHPPSQNSVGLLGLLFCWDCC